MIKGSVIDRILFRRAVRLYARRLPRILAQTWGKGQFFTPDQIRVAAGKAKLPLAYLEIGYAAFLPLETFTAVTEHAPLRAPYQVTRALFRDHLLWRAIRTTQGTEVGDGGSESGDGVGAKSWSAERVGFLNNSFWEDHGGHSGDYGGGHGGDVGGGHH